MKKLNKTIVALATFAMAAAAGTAINLATGKANKASATSSTFTFSAGALTMSGGTGTMTVGSVTMTQAKGTSSTALQTTSANPLRVYQNHVLTFTATAGNYIHSIAFNCNTAAYATTLSTATFSIAGTKTIDGTNTKLFTWSDLSSNSVNVITSSGQVRLDSLVVTYDTTDVKVPAMALSANELHLAIGGNADTSITATSTDFTGTVTYSISGADAAIAAATIDASTGVITVTPSSTATVTAQETLVVSATDGTTTKTANLLVTIGLPYNLISDSTGLKPGKVIIASTDGTYAATNSVASNKIAATKTLAGTNTIYSTPSVDEYVLGLAPVKDEYTLATSDGKYIYAYTSVSGSTTYYDLSTKTTLDADCYWSIAVTSGVAVITGQSSTANGGTLEYYNQNFTFYSGNNNLHLYSVSSTELSSIAITGTAATQTKGNAPDATGLTVTATFADSTTADVTAWATWTPTAIAADTTALTASVTIGGVTKTANIACTVKTATLVSIAVTTQPTKTTYENGETLDLTGIVITGTYDDSSTLNVTTSATYSIAEGTALTTAGVNTITVTVDAKTATFTVTVNKAAFTSVMTSTTAGFVTATTTGAEFAATKEFDGNRWTLRASGASASMPVYAGQTKTINSVSHYAEQVGNGNYPSTSISLRSGIIKGATNSEVKITKIIAYFAGASKTSAGTVTCKIGSGSTYTTCATTLAISGNTAWQSVTFEFASGAYGHIEFDISSISLGIFIGEVNVFGDTDDSDTGVAYELAHRVEMADGCTTATLSTLYTGFQDDLSQFSTEATNTFNIITIDEAPDKTTTAATADLCTTAVKLAAMNARIAAGSSSIKLATENEATTSTAIVLIAFAAIIGCGAYLYIRRRKHA